MARNPKKYQVSSYINGRLEFLEVVARSTHEGAFIAGMHWGKKLHDQECKVEITAVTYCGGAGRETRGVKKLGERTDEGTISKD